MKNKEDLGTKYTIIICASLMLLILITFFQVAFGKEKKKEPMEISVLLYTAGPGAWETLQQGLARAEDDFSVDINYVTIREEADAGEQLATIRKEIDNGAQAIIIAVTDWKGWNEIYKDNMFSVPVVAVESGFGDHTIPYISADNYEMGRLLGEQILSDIPDKEQLVVAVDQGKWERESVIQREEGLKAALGERARYISVRAAFNGETADVAVGLEKDSLLVLAENEKQSMRQTKIYGIGSTASIVAALDYGKIEKIVFQNEFNMGYLAVEYLVRQKGKGVQSDREPIDYFCVGRKEIYDSPFEQLLFPIVE